MIRIIFVLIFSFSLNAADTLTYSVGVENLDYAPHFYVEKAGKRLVYKGFAREILDLFQGYYNSVEKKRVESGGGSFVKMKLVYKPLPVKRL